MANAGPRPISGPFVIFAIAAVCGAALFVLFLVRLFVLLPFSISSGAMQPTLHIGDDVVASAFAYWNGTPQRGDVVATHVWGVDRAIYIKRVVGLPGDRIALSHGVVYLNGMAIARRDLGPADDCDCEAELFEETLPGGRSWRVLDREPDSDLDEMPETTVPAGRYFLLGDDRDQSMDSRYPKFGTVARGDIVGRVDGMFVAGGRWTWQPVR
jgi:signal peptidase I